MRLYNFIAEKTKNVILMSKHIVEDLCVESCRCWTIYDTVQSTHFSMSLPEYKL